MSIETTNAAGLKRFSLNGQTMGTRFTALFYAKPDLDEEKLGNSLQMSVDRVDQQMSTWKPESDLCRLNNAPLGEFIALPPLMAKVLGQGLQIEAMTQGAFDMNVGTEVAASGFGASAGQPVVENRNERRSASQSLDLQENLLLVRKLLPVNLDLSGIAKGFGVDELARCLERAGIQSYLVGIDGEMRAKGRKPDGDCWAVALERPVDGVREVMGVVELENQAIATSGDYRHFRIVDGKRISHTIDPRTGLPLSNDVASVSVIAPNCMEADALATALMVMGPEDGPAFAREHRINALFLVRAGQGFEEIAVGRHFAN